MSETRAFQRIGVVGAGAMGSGIAQVALASGASVVLFDENRESLEASAAKTIAWVGSEVEKGRLSVAVAQSSSERLMVAEALSDFSDVDVVIEAIVERLEAKQSLFRALEAIVRDDAILASNTSSLSIASIGKFCRQQGRVCGMHFFNPVPVMKLAEIIVGPATNADTAERARELALQLGKTPVTVKDAPGFLVNLGGRAYVTEALHILQEKVASVETIDRIMRQACGFRMGPFELMDLTGIDVNLPVTTFIYKGYQHDPRLKTTSMHHLLAEAGKYGRKSGEGFHRYPAEWRAPQQSLEHTRITESPFAARLPERGHALERLTTLGLRPGGDRDPVLIAPLGEDATTVAHRLGVDPGAVVAVDMSGFDRQVITLMAPPVDSWALPAVRAWLQVCGYAVEVVEDTPGFVAQRILAMIANLGCEMAQLGIGSPSDIDCAMELGLNYPSGPLAMVDRLGAKDLHQTLLNLQAITGSDRYRPSLWLRRCALLGVPAHTLRPAPTH